MQAPTTGHWKMVERILRYLKGNPGKGIWMNCNGSTEVKGYCDADWAGDKADRRSTTGYCTFVGENLVTWRSKKQKVVSLSSAEAEYRAMREITKELVWLKALLKDLGIEDTKPIILHCDNQAAIHIASNPVFHERTKHIEIDCHFVRGKIQDGTIYPKFIKSEDQLADVFTKPTTSGVCEYLQGKIGLKDPYQPILKGSVGMNTHDTQDEAHISSIGGTCTLFPTSGLSQRVYRRGFNEAPNSDTFREETCVDLVEENGKGAGLGEASGLTMAAGSGRWSSPAKAQPVELTAETAGGVQLVGTGQPQTGTSGRWSSPVSSWPVHMAAKSPGSFRELQKGCTGQPQTGTTDRWHPPVLLQPLQLTATSCPRDEEKSALGV